LLGELWMTFNAKHQSGTPSAGITDEPRIYIFHLLKYFDC
jgi:hypothetical protein